MQPVEIDREPGWHSGLSTTRRKAVLIADMRRNSTLFRGVLPSIAPPLLGGFESGPEASLAKPIEVDLCHRTRRSRSGSGPLLRTGHIDRMHETTESPLGHCRHIGGAGQVPPTESGGVRTCFGRQHRRWMRGLR